jgi:hypothetical protein
MGTKNSLLVLTEVIRYLLLRTSLEDRIVWRLIVHTVTCLLMWSLHRVSKHSLVCDTVSAYQAHNRTTYLLFIKCQLLRMEST